MRGGQVVYERPKEASPATPDTQIYDLLLKHGRLGDDEQDVAVTGGKIARIGRRLPAAHARVVIEAEGYDLKHAGGAAPCGVATAAGRTGLAEGAGADIVLLEGQRCVLGIRGGRVVWDTEGLSIPDVSRAGPYTNFK